MEKYEYRIFEKYGGRRVTAGFGIQETTMDIEQARRWARQADFIPKSGSWHIERRPVGEWEEIEPEP